MKIVVIADQPLVASIPRFYDKPVEVIINTLKEPTVENPDVLSVWASIKAQQHEQQIIAWKPHIIYVWGAVHLTELSRYVNMYISPSEDIMPILNSAFTEDPTGGADLA